MTLCPCKALCQGSLCSDSFGTPACLCFWGGEKGLLLTPLCPLGEDPRLKSRTLIWIIFLLGRGDHSHSFFTLSVFSGFTLLALPCCGWHSLPSARSDSVSFHFPVIFMAYISSHRLPLEWFSKASGHISSLLYSYLLMLLGLCCIWLAI